MATLAATSNSETPKFPSLTRTESVATDLTIDLAALDYPKINS
jgi:hypothetical protein